jgi:4-hydroxy-3-polyprenylbenzoate decarboxylase
LKEMEGVKMVLYVEHTVDAHDLPVALWRFCNNLDPKRDAILVQRPSLSVGGKTFACLGLTAPLKQKTWIISSATGPISSCSDDATIKSRLMKNGAS